MNQKRRRRDKWKRRRERPSTPRHQELVKALNHPLRVKLLTILFDRIASSTELADRLHCEVSRISYHLRVLVEYGLIEIVGEEPCAGSTSYLFKAVQDALTDGRPWEQLHPRIRSVFAGYLIEAFASEAAGSLASGIFEHCPDQHISRTPLVLDEQGWRNVLAIQSSALKKALQEGKNAANRLSNTPTDAIHVFVDILCFEVQPEI